MKPKLECDTSDWYDGEVSAEDAPDRIREAFSLMRSSGIATIEGESCCSTCSSAALAEFASFNGVDGMAYYHEQNVDDGYDRIFIGFGSVDEPRHEPSDPKDDRRVGLAVIRALHQAGLSHEWDGSPSTKIEVRT